MTGRRRFLAQTMSAAAAAALGSGAKTQAQTRPNVLFIAVDDLNDWIGCLAGHPDSKTPNIDRLAERGVLFTRCYCSAPACNPSRASLLSGIRPSTSGVYRNNQPWRPAMPDAVTIPAHFKANGYYVAGRGKLFHGRYSQDEEGFHEYIPKGGDPMPDKRPLNGLPDTAHFDWGPIDAPDEDMDDWKVTQWACDFLKQDRDEPFFLGVGLYRPHLPWYAPKKYFEGLDGDSVMLPNVNKNDLDDVPQPGRQFARTARDHKRVTEADEWGDAVAGYLACIRFTDANIGRLLDALDESGQADNTIIVFWGDHGWHLGEKLHWRKFALWEEATRMPMIISVPKGIRGGRCQRTVSLLDIYPTLVDLCGLSDNKRLEGDSLTPLLNDPASGWDRPVVTTHQKDNHSVRSERWRYIRYDDGSEELYDHQNDPLEWVNLAAQPEFADIIEAHKKWLPEVNAPEAPTA